VVELLLKNKKLQSLKTLPFYILEFLGGLCKIVLVNKINGLHHISKNCDDEDFVRKWIKVTKDGLERNRKRHKKLITISESNDYGIEEAAHAIFVLNSKLFFQNSNKY